MPRAKKLPSGSWRCRVYSYTDADGKKHQESFTAPTKAEAEMMAAEYAASKKRRARHDLTVSEAINGYITAREAVSSPSTIRGYKQMQRNYYDSIGRLKVRNLTSEDMQLFISELVKKDLSPKSIRNIYGLLTASVALYDDKLTFRVKLPAKQKKRPQSPSDDAVARLYEAASDKMKICIALGCRSVRRGEISALKYEDIVDGVAHIHADMVKNSDGEWIYKEIPKTEGSDRYIKVPDFGSGKGYIVDWTPDSITKRFIDLRNGLGLTIRFHDLRHYFASTAAVLQIPDIYTADMGGWNRDGSTMKKVYQNNIKSLSDYYASKMDKHLSKVLKEDVK
jgi:integrase